MQLLAIQQPHSPLSREHGDADIKKLLEQHPSQIRVTNNLLSRPLFFWSAILKDLQLVKFDWGKCFPRSGNQLRKLVAQDESINPHQLVPRAADHGGHQGSSWKCFYQRMNRRALVPWAFLVDGSPSIHQEKIPTDLPLSLLSPNVRLFWWVPQSHF